MFGWVEAYVTFSMDDYAKAREALNVNGIRYHMKIKDLLGDMRSRMGTLGVNMDYSTQYYLFVKKADLENAQYLIHKAIHN